MSKTDDERCAQQTFDFLEQLKSLDTVPAMQAATFAAIARYGLTHASCVVVPPPGTAARSEFLINNRPQEYTARYFARNYAALDPVILELRHTLRPYSWNDVRTRRPLTKEQLSIMDEGRDFQSRDGLIVPILTDNGTLSIFAPCGLEPNLSTQARSAVEFIGIASHQALRRAAYTPEADTHPLLTNREREVLVWVSMGKTNSEIGTILSMHTLTAKQHLANAMKKLGVYNRQQAAIEAIRRGLITP